MKTKLNLVNRLIIPEMLPKQGGLIEQTIVNEIMAIVRLTSDEIKEYNLKDGPNRTILFDPRKAGIEGEYDFKKQHTDLLKEAAAIYIKALDKKKMVTQNILNTVLKIEKMR